MTHSYLYHQLAQDRFGLRVAARLADASEDLPRDITERLRVARMQALDRRKMVARTASRLVLSGGAATMDHDSPDWGDRIAAIIPLLILVLGLIVINVIQNDRRANEIAEIDAALLTDDLPPAAYTDPGFTQFLKSLSGRD